MKTCVVSLQVATPVQYRDDPHYDRINRLEKSLVRAGFRGDFIAWRGVYPSGCPSHFESPWGFKAFCFEKVREEGYETAIWMDSSVVVIRPLERLLKTVREQGYMLLKNRQGVWGEWCSDEVLAHLGVSRETSFGIPEVNGAVLGLNFSHSAAREFFTQWQQWAADGFVFRGTRAVIQSAAEFEAIKWNANQIISTHPRVRGHRHDQTAAGVLAWRAGMTLSPGMITESYADAWAHRETVFMLERDKSVPLAKILRRIFWVEPLKTPLRKLLRRARLI